MNRQLDARACPNCGTASNVTESRTGKYGMVRRRRTCPKCKYRWTTYEITKQILELIKTLNKLD